MMASTNLHARIKTELLRKLFLPKPLLTIEFLKTTLPSLPLSHPPKLQAQNVLNV